MYMLRVARQASIACVIVACTLATGACTITSAHAPLAPSSVGASATRGEAARGDMYRALDAGLLARNPQRALVDVIALQWPLLTAAERTRPSLWAPDGDRVGVYANGHFIGGLTQIQDVSAGQVARLRRLTPGEEFIAFGRRHSAGAIVIDWAGSKR